MGADRKRRRGRLLVRGLWLRLNGLSAVRRIRGGLGQRCAQHRPTGVAIFLRPTGHAILVPTIRSQLSIEMDVFMLGPQTTLIAAE